MGKTIVIALFFIILLGSCKKKDVLRGFDKRALFAPPSTGELETIKTIWQKRNLIPENIIVEDVHVINSQLSFQLLSFRLNDNKQYAGVLVPKTSKPLPVHLNVFGFALDVPVSYQNIKLDSSDTSSLPFLFVFPALRGQSLNFTVNDKTYTSPVSEGTRDDAFDGAADDALACLNAAILTFKNADTSRVMINGGSRGGTVALLVAERDKRIKRAAAVAFPTDLLGLTAEYQQDPTYQFQFLNALVNGTATLEETRIKMIASSPLYFCSQLPKTQIHFGEKDNITPAAQGQLLFNAMKTLGLQDRIEMFVYKGRSHSDIGNNNNNEMGDRIQSFFRQLW
jgi:dienelactone hydrolase